ncbi:helix-turn-helix transcriptional regulator [Rubrivirga marina]|uniref:HTH luxR-type domain-containing protein n=1 Tax=Rubrivirga marina TaxID=1196024 RepID=A0A271IW71_9BACT|nr:LuxR C-terminal-related transcriptional regulator [Rubrivirga marina]PAP75054.1 hypothetical protein BSZ37_00605 [Rubrivirga marina]
MHGHDDAHAEMLRTFCGPVAEGGGGPDPLLDEAYRLITRPGTAVGDLHTVDHLLGATGTAFNTLFYHEVLRPFGTADAQSIVCATPAGIVHLTATQLRRPPEPGEHVPLLRVLAPALTAGLDALGRLAAHRRSLDVVQDPLAAFDADGREAHRNPALVAALAADPERERVEGALRLVARALAPLAFKATGAAPTPVVREVQTACGRYTLRGVLVAPGAFGGTDAFLVTVDPPGGPALPTHEAVRARHGLTRREAEVALLLAEGLSNEALGARLFVSKHTARHHVEAILLKLDVPGRAAVAARLMQPA